MIKGVTEYVDGNKLWGYCDERADGPRPDVCKSYVTGVADGIDVEEMSWSGQMPYCVKGVTTDQLTDVVRRFLGDHPEKRNWAAAVLVFAALNKAFPCKAHP